MTNVFCESVLPVYDGDSYAAPYYKLVHLTEMMLLNGSHDDHLLLMFSVLHHFHHLITDMTASDLEH